MEGKWNKFTPFFAIFIQFYPFLIWETTIHFWYGKQHETTTKDSWISWLSSTWTNRSRFGIWLNWGLHSLGKKMEKEHWDYELDWDDPLKWGNGLVMSLAGRAGSWATHSKHLISSHRIIIKLLAVIMPMWRMNINSTLMHFECLTPPMVTTNQKVVIR